MQPASGVDDQDVGVASGRRTSRHRTRPHSDRRLVAVRRSAPPPSWPTPRAAPPLPLGRYRPRQGSRACPHRRVASRACRSWWSCPTRSRPPPSRPRGRRAAGAGARRLRAPRRSRRGRATGSAPDVMSDRTRCTRSAAALGPTSALIRRSSSWDQVASPAPPLNRTLTFAPRPSLRNTPPEGQARGGQARAAARPDARARALARARDPCASRARDRGAAPAATS